MDVRVRPHDLILKNDLRPRRMFAPVTLRNACETDERFIGRLAMHFWNGYMSRILYDQTLREAEVVDSAS